VDGVAGDGSIGDCANAHVALGWWMLAPLYVGGHMAATRYGGGAVVVQQLLVSVLMFVKGRPLPLFVVDRGPSLMVVFL
jgi:hypothetical protein